MNKRALFTVLLTLFVDLVGFSILFPVYAEMMAYYVAQGDSVVQFFINALAGLGIEREGDQINALVGSAMFAVYSGSQFLMAPLWGNLSDRYGRRPILLWSALINVLAAGLWIWAGSFLLLITSRLISGAMSGHIGTASAAVADVSSNEKRTIAMGMLGAAFGLGFLCGPALGGIIYHLFPITLANEMPASGFHIHPFSQVAVFAAILALINFLFIVFCLPETNPDRKPSETKRTSNPFAIFKGSGAATPAVLLYLCYTVLFAGMEATLVFLGRDYLAMDPLALTGLFIWIGIISILVQGGLVRRLAPKYSDKALSSVGFFFVGAGFLIIALLPALQASWCLYLGTALSALGSSLIAPALSGYTSRVSSEEEQGQRLGYFRSSGALGRMLGPALAGLLYVILGASFLYVFSAVVLFVLAVASRMLLQRPTAIPT